MPYRSLLTSNKTNLRMKLTYTYWVFIMVPVIILGIVLYLITKNQAEREIRNLSMQTVHQSNQIFDEYISHIDSISLMPYTDKELENHLLETVGINIYDKSEFKNENNVQNFLSNLLKIKQDIEYVSIIYLDGSYISKSSRGNSIRNDNFFDQYDFEQLIQSKGEKVISKVHDTLYETELKKQVVSLGRRILDFTKGFYTGYIVIDCNTDLFTRVCEKIEITPNSTLAVLDGYKNIVYRQRDGTQDNNLTLLLDSIIDKDHRNINNVFVINGRKYIVVSEQSTYTQWTTVAIIPYKDIQNKMSSTRYIFILLGVICVLLILIISLVISNNITQPIKSLIEGMKKVKEGDTDVEIHVESYPELAELSNTFNALVQEINQLSISIETIEIKRVEAELNALKNQINPHFLYNTLESIRMMAVIEDQKDISKAIKAVANLFRYSTKRNEDLVSVRQELSYAKDYIYIQKLRYDDRFDVEVEIEDQSLLDNQIVRFSIQPLIENAIYHGLGNKTEKGRIRISVSEEASIMTLIIEDNGMGMCQSILASLQKKLNNRKRREDDSIGLDNVNKRIKLYFGSQYGIFIESSEGIGTKIIMNLPSIKYQ